MSDVAAPRPKLRMYILIRESVFSVVRSLRERFANEVSDPFSKVC
jgi:hypothetical protein